MPCSAPLLLNVEGRSERAAADFPLRVVTLNMAEQSSPEHLVNLLNRDDRLTGADILLLQEVIFRPDQKEDFLSSLSSRLGWHASFATTTHKRLDGSLEGVAIISRHPLLDPEALALPRYTLRVRSRCRVALAATVEVGGQPVRIVNVHLDTRVNAEQRVNQLTPAIRLLKNFDGPALFGGDLNTNDMYWFAHLLPVPFVQNQAATVVRAFEEHGFHTPQGSVGPPTLPILRQRLDWIFLLGLKANGWGVRPVDFSDHHAVWMSVTADASAPQE